MPRRTTGLWRDMVEAPAALADTLEAADGVDETAALLGAAEVRRIVATGNGAAYYTAQALWLASLWTPGAPPVVAVPGGMVAGGRFPWREGDRLLAISSSGEFRDVIEAIAAGAPAPYAAITANAGSTVGAGAGARALQRVRAQRAVTHTQVWCNGIALALAVLARASGDDGLARALAGLPAALAAAVDEADAWADGLVGVPLPRAAVVFGSGAAWAAGLEGALLLKEVARVPAEGCETREGATTSMFGLGPGDLAVGLATRDDGLLAEALELCRGQGADVLEAPGGQAVDPRLAPVTCFPAALALAIELALPAGHDVDRPAWTDAYYTTARQGGKEDGT